MHKYKIVPGMPAGHRDPEVRSSSPGGRSVGLINVANTLRSRWKDERGQGMWKCSASSKAQGARWLWRLTSPDWLGPRAVAHARAGCVCPGSLHFPHADRGLSDSSRERFSLPSPRPTRGPTDQLVLDVPEPIPMEALGTVSSVPRQWVELLGVGSPPSHGCV